MGQYFYCLLTVISTHQVRIIDRITESCLLEVMGLSNLSVPDPDLDPGSFQEGLRLYHQPLQLCVFNHRVRRRIMTLQTC